MGKVPIPRPTGLLPEAVIKRAILGYLPLPMSSGSTAPRWNVNRSGLLGKRAGVLVLLVLISFSSPSLAHASVVGLWHLDERTGTTAKDSSGKGHPGHIMGPMTLGVSGKRNTAYRFTPKSAITVRDAPDLRPGKANVSISYWMKATIPPASADYDIFVKGERGSPGGQIKLEVFAREQGAASWAGPARRAVAPRNLPAERQSDHPNRRRGDACGDQGDRRDQGQHSYPNRFAPGRRRLVPRRPGRSHLLHRLSPL
jgi:hypothetical protein